MTENLIKAVWNRRAMVWAIAVNDLKLRYKKSFLGFFWSFLEPLLILAVMYVVFTNIFDSHIENYPLYLLLGIITWFFVDRGTSIGITSLTSRGSLIQKIYFRRELLVISVTLTAFFMMFFELVAFFIFLIIFGVLPPIEIILFPLVLLILFSLTLGLSLIFAPLNVYYRDIQPIWNVILRAGFFLSPIFYRLDIFPENIRMLLQLNPVAGIMDMARAFTMNFPIPSNETIIYSVSVSLAILGIGILVFKKLDHHLVEEL